MKKLTEFEQYVIVLSVITVIIGDIFILFVKDGLEMGKILLILGLTIFLPLTIVKLYNQRKDKSNIT